MERNGQNNDFLALVVAHCDGTASDAERQRLAEMLRNDPELRRQFVLHLQVHAALKFGGPKFFSEDTPTTRKCMPLPDPSFFEGLCGEALPDLGDISLLDGMYEAPKGEDTFFRSPLFSLFTFFSRPVPLTIIVIAMLVLPLAMLGWLSMNQPKVIPHTAPCQVAKTAGCVWDETKGGVLKTGSRLTSDERYYLKEGIVQLDFASGVKTIIQGPAEFRPKSPMLLELTQGRLAAKVPPRGRNFTVTMPGLEVIDRGTEFGVSVDRTTEVELHVFKGQIDVIVDCWKQEANDQSMELRAGQASRVDRTTGKVTKMAADPTEFVCEFADRSGLTLDLVNSGFEKPSVPNHPKHSTIAGNLREVEIPGWTVMNTDNGSPLYLQQAPYLHDPTNADLQVKPCDQNAIDGTQMLAVTLTNQVNKAWAFQPIGTIETTDIGKTLVVSAEVVAQKLGPDAPSYGDTATAVLAFTIDASEKEPGEVIGFPGFVTSIKTNKRSRHLEAKMQIRPYMVGKKVSVQLLIRDTDIRPDCKNEYFFDKVELKLSPNPL